MTMRIRRLIETSATAATRSIPFTEFLPFAWFLALMDSLPKDHLGLGAL
jgi:hypothetical protein